MKRIEGFWEKPWGERGREEGPKGAKTKKKKKREAKGGQLRRGSKKKLGVPVQSRNGRGQG